MCMRVWHTVMTLRNEPKELYGAVYDAIMLGWEPVPIKAQVVLPFQVILNVLYVLPPHDISLRLILSLFIYLFTF